MSVPCRCHTLREYVQYDWSMGCGCVSTHAGLQLTYGRPSALRIRHTGRTADGTQHTAQARQDLPPQGFLEAEGDLARLQPMLGARYGLESGQRDVAMVGFARTCCRLVGWPADDAPLVCLQIIGLSSHMRVTSCVVTAVLCLDACASQLCLCPTGDRPDEVGGAWAGEGSQAQGTRAG